MYVLYHTSGLKKAPDESLVLKLWYMFHQWKFLQKMKTTEMEILLKWEINRKFFFKV